jgi:methyl-accepting chemotaxis protein
MNDARDRRRRTYFIEKKFQADFIIRFCLLVVGGGLLTTALVYIFSSRAASVSIVNSRVVVRSTADFILPVLVQNVAVTMIVVGLATIAVTLLYSHRIAGPLYRFKKVLEAMGEGDYSAAFKIRNLDQLKILAGALNDAVVNNRARIRAAKDCLKALEGRLDALVASSPEPEKGRAAEIKALFLEAKEKLDHFKTS